MATFFTTADNFESYNVTFEAELEDLIEAYAERIWPDIKLVRTKPQFIGSLGAGKPDMLGFRLSANGEIQNWYLIEVELARHQVLEHISAQVQRFAAFRFEVSDAERVSDQCLAKLNGANAWELERMVLRQPPEILIVVDRVTEQLRRSLENLTFDVLVTETRPYRNIHGERALAVDDEMRSSGRPSALVTLASERPFFGFIRIRAVSGYIPSIQNAEVEISGEVFQAKIFQVRNGMNEIHLEFESVQNRAPSFLRSVGRNFKVHLTDGGLLKLSPARI